MNSHINLKDDRSEKVRYDYSDYPLYIRHSNLSSYPYFTAPPHWHDDIEFIAVLNGEMQYNINSEIITIKKNEGVFVNSRQMHFGFSDTNTDCEFICALIHPVLLCITPEIERKFVLPVLQNVNIPFIHLTSELSWQKNIISEINHLYSVRKTSASILKMQSIFTWIWSLFYENIPKTSDTRHPQNNDLSILKDMMGFIQQHHDEKITLQQISVSGGVGQSKCCKLFDKYLNQTPNTYLTSYRLNKSIDLLLLTDMNITEIAYSVGFNGASYFAEIFRKCFNLSPSEYRNQNRDKE